MQENAWQPDHLYPSLEATSPLESSDLYSQPSELSPFFIRGLEGRRRKAATTLAFIWSGTIALHLIPGGSWLVWGTAALLSVYFFRVVRARPHQTPEAISATDADDYPFVSLLVAAKNEESVIAPLVHGLCELDYPKHRYELWIIDDNSTDNTPLVLEKLAKQYPNLHVFRRSPNASGGKSGALNDVWPMTRGDIVAVFDADAQVSKDLLRRVVPLFEQASVGAVQVRKSILNGPENFWTRNQSLEMILDSFLQQQRISIGGIGELRGNGQFVRRSALSQCDGWNEATITDDLDLTLKLHLNQWDIHFLMDPSVGEEGVTSAYALWHQRNRWAEGGYQRYLDYWRLIVRNKLGVRKSIDLMMFCFVQYILPSAAVPDFLMAIARNRLPLLSPLTSVAVLLSFVGMLVGMKRVRHQARLVAAETPALAPATPSLASPRVLMIAIANAIQATLYMLHWLPVIASTTIRMSIRPKRLRWVKTVHRGTHNPSMSPEG